MWKMIRDGAVYEERGGDFFDRLNPQRTARKLTRRLEQIGFHVSLSPRLHSPFASAQTALHATQTSRIIGLKREVFEGRRLSSAR
jgi:hypothetical protein